MELKEVDPFDVTVSELNERNTREVDQDLVENVKAVGVIQPPIVHEVEDESMDGYMGAEYAAVVGGRRVTAAQQADVESIPVMVVDWDDTQSLVASVSENIDKFSKTVSAQDRALTIERLKEREGWENKDVADEFGVHRRTVGNWLEWTRDEWEETSVHPESENERTPASITSDNISTETVKEVRQITEGGEEGEELLKEIQKNGLGKDDVREVKQRTEKGTEPIDAVQEVVQEKEQVRNINRTKKVNIDITVVNGEAKALEQAAKDRGATVNQTAERIITDWLEEEDYL